MSLKVANGNYYCEQAKVKLDGRFGFGNVTVPNINSYLSDFKCETDGNGKGMLNSSIGLLTYDELLYAGGYVSIVNKEFYLTDSTYLFWTMSSNGYWAYPYEWVAGEGIGTIPTLHSSAQYMAVLKPVINLKADTQFTGNGTLDNMYMVK